MLLLTWARVAVMLILETMLQAHFDTTSAAVARVREGELLPAALHGAAIRLGHLFGDAASACGVPFPNFVLVFAMRMRNRQRAKRADYHATVRGLSPLGTIMGIIAEMMRTVSFAAGVTLERK
eukprot:CAMPEP_0181469830 /NCGR_PEP_ID=MMETSP1110-20121109/38228_1 /TAXON_ID=174948 /ORGANISM="Symbiodinium sp., Strain CCMP421" /LENGTH=122 /DNA_ID=CAMNT_0023594763 /DNA_START=272 /DNA_END=640 /DNA_ORIENTATION=+